MRIQLLTILMSLGWSSAALMAALTAALATARRWRDQRVVAFHMLTGALYGLGMTLPTVEGVPVRALQIASAFSITVGALHHHAWRRVLALIAGRSLYRWEYVLGAITVAWATLGFVPNLLIDDTLFAMGYAPWGLGLWDVAPNAAGCVLIAVMMGAHLQTVVALVVAARKRRIVCPYAATGQNARVANVGSVCPFAVAALGELVFTLIDMASIAGILPFPYLTPFWSMLYVLVIPSLIARRFTRDADELDTLSTLLEERVASRTRELVEARRLAEEALEARGKFLAMMSHEIRTPLHGILGMTSVLLEGTLSDEQRTQLETIHRCGSSLLTLLNDVLDFSKIEAGRMQLESIPYAPRRLVAECLDVLACAAAEGATQLRSTIGDDVPARLMGDPTRVRQVLLNLVSNALKFARGGVVTVRVERSEGRVRFSVHDTGIGLTAQALAKIFQPFVQAESSTARHFGGTGLGLAICKRLVDAMGGEINAESAPGCGSTFWFTLPIVLAPETAQPDMAPTEPSLVKKSQTPLRVLVAEDNTVNQRVVSLLLTRHGHQVCVVKDGKEALDALATASYDVVLMDCEMPVLDGYTATRLLRQREVDGHRTRVVALTANAFEEDRRRALAAGMDAWLSKPFHQEELLRVLTSTLPPPCAQPALS